MPADTDDLHVRRVVRPGDLAGPRALVDVAGYAHDAYGADKPTLFLVRPDGYVARVSDAGDPAALAQYP